MIILLIYGGSMKKLFLLPLILLIFSCGSKDEVSAENADNRPFRNFTTDFSNSLVKLDEIFSGGPPKDGIPAIDNPQFIGISEANQTTGDREPVIVVRYLGETKIYPVQILTWHEIVNDSIAGLPIAVTFCPLCNTGIVFESRMDGVDLDFGTTGRLRFSNQIIYDRQKETRWQQATGEGIAGKFVQRKLKFIPSLFLSWKDAMDRYPEADVLSINTGWDRPYGTNPYADYDSGSPFLYRGDAPPLTDENLRTLDRILTVAQDNEIQHYSYKTLRQEKVINDQLNNRKIVVFWSTGTASALDASRINDGRDVGTANAFLSNVKGEDLEFYSDGKIFRDRKTGSIWDKTGYAVSGTLVGEKLELIVGTQHFWFSAAAFFP
jgi:hypothetical protein